MRTKHMQGVKYFIKFEMLQDTNDPAVVGRDRLSWLKYLQHSILPWLAL
jgi:hypothetical protein